MKGDQFVKQYVKWGKILPNNVERIVDDLYIMSYKIKKIENLPKYITGSLFLNNNRIEKIENLPDIVKGDLELADNKIQKIENLPGKIGRDLGLNSNKIQTIENLPDHVFRIHITGNDINNFGKIDSDFKYIVFNKYFYNPEGFELHLKKFRKTNNMDRFLNLLSP